MDKITIHNHLYAYKVHQRKRELPFLLMLHGFMGDHRVFDHLVNDLCRVCNPVTVDLLGYGASSKPADPQSYSREKQISDLLTLIEKLELSPLVLFGYSMGGRLALQTALAHPEPFRGLILESTTCGIEDNSDRSKRRKADKRRARHIETDYSGFLSMWKKLDLFDSPLPADKSLLARHHNIQREQQPKSVAASLRGFGTGSMKPICGRLHTLTIPVLILAGTDDDKYQQISTSLKSKLPCARFSSVKAGHRTHLDNPIMFTRKVQEAITDDLFTN